MVSAGALQAQIVCQRQRVKALEDSLTSMPPGMDKHMVQVQVKYARGYLESLREQLAWLRGGVVDEEDDSSSSNDGGEEEPQQQQQQLAAAPPAPAAALTPQPQPSVSLNAAVASTAAAALGGADKDQQPQLSSPHPTCPRQAGFNSQFEQPHAGVSDGMSAGGAVAFEYLDLPPEQRQARQHTIDQQQQQLEGRHEAQSQEECVGLRLTTAGAEKGVVEEDYPPPGDSLVDEDDWVCLQDPMTTGTADRDQHRAGGTGGLSSWVGFWGWGGQTNKSNNTGPGGPT